MAFMYFAIIAFVMDTGEKGADGWIGGEMCVELTELENSLKVSYYCGGNDQLIISSNK